jgi:riboflavin synthase
MFTGIIKELGRVRSISGLGRLYKLQIEARDIISGSVIGDSIAVNGVCLTLTGKTLNTLSFDVMGETMKRSGLSKLKYGDTVNLEDSLKVGGPLGGHLVSGHIDCTGRIKDIRRTSDEVSMEITFPEEYSGLVVEKGSITLDGISLTIGKAGKNSIIIYIIPHTLKMTTLGSRCAGDEINIEFDIIGKYVARLIGK